VAGAQVVTADPEVVGFFAGLWHAILYGAESLSLGPVVGAGLVVLMKTVGSAYIERWNLVLGVIFVTIVIFMPDGIVPGTKRLWYWSRRVLRGPGGTNNEDRS